MTSNVNAGWKNSLDTSKRGASDCLNRRWIAMTKDKIYSFKEEQDYRNPTEVIEVKDIKAIKTNEAFGKTGLVTK